MNLCYINYIIKPVSAIMISNLERCYASGLTWEEGKTLLIEILLRNLHKDFLEQLYTLKQGDLCINNYARKFDDFIVSIVESKCMTIMRVKSRLRVEIKDAKETAIRFEFRKF